MSEFVIIVYPLPYAVQGYVIAFDHRRRQPSLRFQLRASERIPPNQSSMKETSENA